MAVLTKNLQFGYIGRVTLIAATISISATILLALLGYGYWSLIYPQLLSTFVSSLLFARKAHLGFKVFGLNYLIVGFKYTKRLIGSILGFNTLNYWARNSDNLLVGKLYGASELGIYNRAYTLLTLPLTLITGLFTNVLFPSLKKNIGDHEQTQSKIYFVLNTISVLTLPITIILVIYPTQLVDILWGTKWEKVGEILPYFGLLLFTQSLLSTVGQILVLYLKERQFMISGWIGAIVMITFIALGARLSLLAIAKYYSFSYLFIILPFNIFYCYLYALEFNRKQVIIFWAPKVMMSILIWMGLLFSNQYLIISGVIGLVINVGLSFKNDITNVGFATIRRIKLRLFNNY